MCLGAVEKHFWECLKFYKNWSQACLLGLSNALLLGYGFLPVTGTPGKVQASHKFFCREFACVCRSRFSLVRWQTWAICTWVLRDASPPPIDMERCFLFHCPFRIIFASEIGLQSKSVSSKMCFRLPVWTFCPAQGEVWEVLLQRWVVSVPVQRGCVRTTQPTDSPWSGSASPFIVV